MRKITDLIVKFRNIFLIIFIVFAVVCFYLQKKVKINDDIMSYLPKTSETKIGNDIMTGEFDKLTTSYLNVMFKDLSVYEKKETYNKLLKVKGVASVTYENTKEYNKGKYTLYKITVDDSSDSKLAREVYNSIDKNFKVDAMSGSIFDENKPLVQWWIIALAITSALIVLILLADFWLEPLLYLFTIGIAVFINKGTNIMFGSVSSITNAIVAVLQLALSMDYSIMLTNRFKQEKEKHDNKYDAMKEALYQSFKAISSSSLTTIVGLLALVFMSFTIGKDLGFILAKGVLLSLVCIFFCLPALLITFDNLILKTKKKSLNIKSEKLSKFSFKFKHIQSIGIVILFVLAFLIKGNVQILYTDIEQDKVGKIFGTNNQIAIVYEGKYSVDVDNYLLSLSDDKNVSTVLSYDLLLKQKLTANEIVNLISSFNSSIKIDEDLVKFIYYMKFDGTIHDNLTINDLILMVQNNDFISNYVSNNYYINIDKIIEDNNSKNLDKRIEPSYLKNYLVVSEEDLNLVYLLYNSSVNYNDEWKLTAEELFNFIKELLSQDESLTKYIPSDRKLALYINFNKISNIESILVSNKYKRAVLNTNYKLEGKETFEFIKKMKDEFKGKSGIYVVGMSPMAYEMSHSFNGELNKITLLTILFIFVVVAFTFKDLIIPFVLVLMIQCAVYLTMSYISLTGGSLYFIAILIVQAILMGATIDYAIVYTSYYKEGRLTMNVKDAIKYAYSGSIKTIISSASTLIIVTLIVSNFAFAIAAKICKTISQGTLCSFILVLFILPGVLATCDKLICRGKEYKKIK